MNDGDAILKKYVHIVVVRFLTLGDITEINVLNTRTHKLKVPWVIFDHY